MRRTIITLLLILISSGIYAATSTNYAISTEVIDLGGGPMGSTTYNMYGKMREIKPELMTSTSYTLEGRFLGMVYGLTAISTFELPVITAITPNLGYNDRSYTVTIEGSNISFEAAVRLEKSGQSSITGTIITIESSGLSVEATFNLLGAVEGPWNVAVVNTGYGLPERKSVLTNGFNVLSMGALRIIGTPVNDPNPFNPSDGPTKIKYKLSAAATITLYLFNQRGELIWQKTYGSTENGGKAGDNDPTWDGGTDFNESVPTGVYVLSIVARSGGSTKELGRVKVAVLRR